VGSLNTDDESDRDTANEDGSGDVQATRPRAWRSVAVSALIRSGLFD
jgi:hypothetical protein